MALLILQSTQPEFTTGICCKGDSVSTAGLYKLSGFSKMNILQHRMVVLQTNTYIIKAVDE